MTTAIKPLDAVDARRRALLQVGVAAAGGLLIGFETARATPGAAAAANRRESDGVFAPNAFIRIDSHGKITLIMPQVEMGQGVYTSLAMILAEELDAAFDQVVLEAAPPNEKLYANPVFGVQATGNSNSIRAFGCRCARRQPRPARCWCRPPPEPGRLMPPVAAPTAAP
jgi:isoquinoline 1-oxidoreductase beta subunit